MIGIAVILVQLSSGNITMLLPPPPLAVACLTSHMLLQSEAVGEGDDDGEDSSELIDGWVTEELAGGCIDRVVGWLLESKGDAVLLGKSRLFVSTAMGGLCELVHEVLDDTLVEVVGVSRSGGTGVVARGVSDEE